MMKENRLNIVSVEEKSSFESPVKANWATRRQEIIAKYERLWKTYPDKYNPNRDCMQRERIKRTWELLQNHVEVKGKRAADLGCGYGLLSEKLHEAEALSIDAMDAAQLALDKIPKETFPRIKCRQDCLPNTLLEDEFYDIVIATDVIGELAEIDFRLFFSELSRVIKDDGRLVCSTALDIHSEDALERFATLAETEFEVIEWVFSFNRPYIRICDFFEAPERFVKASQDPEYLQYAVKKRYSVGAWWFKMNAKRFPALVWKCVSPLSRLISKRLKNATGFMLFLERAAKHWYNLDGATHVVVVAKKRPLMPELSPEECSEPERKGKKFIWE